MSSTVGGESKSEIKSEVMVMTGAGVKSEVKSEVATVPVASRESLSLSQALLLLRQGKTSTKLITISSKDGEVIQVPEFLVARFPLLHARVTKEGYLGTDLGNDGVEHLGIYLYQSKPPKIMTATPIHRSILKLIMFAKRYKMNELYHSTYRALEGPYQEWGPELPNSYKTLCELQSLEPEELRPILEHLKNMCLRISLQWYTAAADDANVCWDALKPNQPVPGRSPKCRPQVKHKICCRHSYVSRPHLSSGEAECLREYCCDHSRSTHQLLRPLRASADLERGKGMVIYQEMVRLTSGDLIRMQMDLWINDNRKRVDLDDDQ